MKRIHATFYSPRFRKKAMAVAIAVMAAGSAGAVNALESLSDGDMGEVAGAGIAFLPEDASMRFLGADGLGNDTGYIHIVPVGPLSDASLTNTIYGSTTGKADVYLYGLSISKSDDDINSRFGDSITSWGTAGNPWLLKVQTDSSVQDFSTSNSTGQAVSYLSLEAPLYDTAVPTDSTKGADAYNLKLAFWADIFNRKGDVAEGASDQFDVGGSGRQNRLRLQYIWNGLSINGTNIKMFQTLGGAANSGGMNTSYNNTFGLSALIRMNSGDSANLKAVVSGAGVSRTQNGDWTTVWDGTQTGTTMSSPGGAGSCQNGATTGAAPVYTSVGCQFRARTRSFTDSIDLDWTAPALEKILRISSSEDKTKNGADLTTPATGGSTPKFLTNEGLYLYNPNINLPLGSLAQPLTAGLAADGRNLVLEIARIPNKASAYNNIYTNYDNASDVLAKNCNVYSCGTALTGYQGATATHGSISIGTASLNSNNELRAYTGIEAVGVSFGELMTSPGAHDSTTLNELQYQYRTLGVAGTWCGSVSYTLGVGGCKASYIMNDWVYLDAEGSYIVVNRKATPASASCTKNILGSCSATSNNSASAGYPNVNNRDWSAANIAWLSLGGTGSDPGIESELKTFLGGSYATITAVPQPNTYNANSVIPLNNLGSAVIDGILIQHMKFTTTGL